VSQGFAKSEFADPGWQDYTPSYANLTIGNGTVVARYTQVGTTVHVSFSLTLGSTSAVGTAPSTTMPVAEAAGYITNRHVLGGSWSRAAGSNHIGFVKYTGSQTVQPYIYQSKAAADPHFQLDQGLSATSPATWTTGDILTMDSTYEAASAV